MIIKKSITIKVKKLKKFAEVQFCLFYESFHSNKIQTNKSNETLNKYLCLFAMNCCPPKITSM